MDPLSAKLAIFGPGLLGGSLAGAVRRHHLAGEIRVWGRREEAVAAVMARGWADLGSVDVAPVIDGADFIVLATPVGAMPDLARHVVALRDRLADDVVITDVGSVKGYVAAHVAPIFEAAGLRFYGSHPMAGAETAGFEAARDDLFAGAACIVTPDAAAEPRLRTFWEHLGCRISTLSPDAHDAAVARISHLPHVAASAVVMAGLSDDPARGAVAGRGFRDTTRIGSGDPDLWTEILLENRTALVPALEDLVAHLTAALDFVRHADDGHLRQFLAEAKSLRDQALTAPDSPPHG